MNSQKANTYIPKYDYENFTPSFRSRGNQHVFQIISDDGFQHFHYTSLHSIEDAENNVYKHYQQSQSCQHEWQRLGHSTSARCVSCNLYHSHFLKPLHSCDHLSCENDPIASFSTSLLLESGYGDEDNHYCLEHFQEKISEYIESTKDEKVSIHTHFTMEVGARIFFNYLFKHSNITEVLSERELAKFIYDYSSKKFRWELRDSVKYLEGYSHGISDRVLDEIAVNHAVYTAQKIIRKMNLSVK